MPEVLNAERAIFPKGRQKTFVVKAIEELGLSTAASICSCSERTLRDWRREKFRMPFSAVLVLSKAMNIPPPLNLRTKSQYAHTSAAGRKGYQAVLVKHKGIPRNETSRKKAWQAWWDGGGKHLIPPSFQSTSVPKPRKSTALAELIGIFMGDGSLSAYQASVTLHHRDDIEYAQFVSTLIRKTCKVTATLYHYPKKSAVTVTVSRKQLVKHLHDLGLPIGNKILQGLDVPNWIKENRSMSIACLRGLIDTDGCVFTHRYKSKGHSYSYKKLQFTSMSIPLRTSVYKILVDLGISPRLSGSDVRIDSVADVKKYFNVVGSHNPKHLKRYEQ